MISSRTIRDFLDDIRSAAVKAQGFVSGMDYDTFAADEKTAYAVVRALEIIGEATKRVPEEVRQKQLDIPWRSMSGLRDKLIHDYISVDLEVVWKTVHEDLPGLIVGIERMIQQQTT